MKSLVSIKNLIGRQIAKYNRNSSYRDCNRHHINFNKDGSFDVHTQVANGDNVPWAHKVHNYIYVGLQRHGIRLIFDRGRMIGTHSNGNVSRRYKLNH